jgi:hypothetical protein
MVVLFQWKFTVDPALDPHDHPGRDLDSLFKTIDAAALSVKAGAIAPGATVSKRVQTLLDRGAAVLAHQNRAGDRVPSVYHGPLRPAFRHRHYFNLEVDHSDDRTLPFDGGSDDLLLYDPAIGIFDVSYAAAWQLGRLLALGDRRLINALFAWRRANHRALHQQVREQETGVLQEPIEHLLASLRRWIGEGPALEANGAGDPLALDGAAHVAAVVAAHETPADVDTGTWRDAVLSGLEAMLRLEGVPFHYLVPDLRMLPDHSIRFFETDPDWLTALAMGALSPGRTTARDLHHDQLIFSDLLDDPRLKLSRREVAGFVLRSRELAGWPALTVRAYLDDGSEVPLKLLRRLSDEVILALFDGTIDRIEIRQPIESVHFAARWVADSSAPGGGRYETADSTHAAIPMRAPELDRVIDVNTLAGDRTSAALAVALLDRAVRAVFRIMYSDTAF